jgi:hypothetical protein
MFGNKTVVVNIRVNATIMILVLREILLNFDMQIIPCKKSQYHIVLQEFYSRKTASRFTGVKFPPNSMAFYFSVVYYIDYLETA